MSDEKNTNDAAGKDAEGAEQDHSLKEDLRGGAAKAWGLAVEVGSLLSGQGGEIVDAEREVAAAEAEELLDRIDGEG